MTEGPIRLFATRAERFPQSDDFDRHCDDCRVENLIQNEAFISASIQVARIVVGTHQEEKRKYLRNALLNIALNKGPDEIRQQVFMNAIEAFSPAHVKAVDLIWRGSLQQDPKAWWGERTDYQNQNYECRASWWILRTAASQISRIYGFHFRLTWVLR